MGGTIMLRGMKLLILMTILLLFPGCNSDIEIQQIDLSLRSNSIHNSYFYKNLQDSLLLRDTESGMVRGFH